MERKDIKDRTFEFALEIVDVSRKLGRSEVNLVVMKQLLRSGTSIGANVEEAVAASSREDFSYRMGIALREARETRYWLRIIKAKGLLDKVAIEPLLLEIEQIMRILGAIVSTTRGTRKKK